MGGGQVVSGSSGWMAKRLREREKMRARAADGGEHDSICCRIGPKKRMLSHRNSQGTRLGALGKRRGVGRGRASGQQFQALLGREGPSTGPRRMGPTWQMDAGPQRLQQVSGQQQVG